MLVEIKDKIVSTQLFEQKFVCDLSACKGACCVEGDAGAPMTLEEIDLISEHLEEIKPFMTAKGIEAVEKSDVFYVDEDNDFATTLVDGKECAFVYFDEKGITKCAIEKAYREKKIDFNKPISCHLFPIRVVKYTDFSAINYSEWSICSAACELGEKLKVPVYQFLKEPITRAFGEDFYKELEIVDQELKKD